MESNMSWVDRLELWLQSQVQAMCSMFNAVNHSNSNWYLKEQRSCSKILHDGKQYSKAESIQLYFVWLCFCVCDHQPPFVFFGRDFYRRSRSKASPVQASKLWYSVCVLYWMAREGSRFFSVSKPLTSFKPGRRVGFVLVNNRGYWGILLIFKLPAPRLIS